MDGDLKLVTSAPRPEISKGHAIAGPIAFAPTHPVVALVLFALAWIVLVWAMYVNRFFSSIPRIQSERGHTVISSGPYRFVRHPGYTAGLLAAITSGIALGSWISTFIAPIALALLVWRTMVEDRMLQRDLPGYADYAARVQYRLVPGVW